MPLLLRREYPRTQAQGGAGPLQSGQNGTADEFGTIGGDTLHGPAQCFIYFKGNDFLLLIMTHECASVSSSW